MNNENVLQSLSHVLIINYILFINIALLNIMGYYVVIKENEIHR